MDKRFIYLIRNAINMSNDRIMNYNKGYEDCGKFFWIYPFTNENISGYIDDFNLENKSLLTTGSSGDQAINAVLRDCKDITVLDINSFTQYYFNLKKAAILTLDYEEFCRFFCYVDYPKVFKYNYDAFNYESYNKIKDILNELDEETYLFWETLFDVCKSSNIRNNLFSNDEESVSVVKRMNLYLKNENYFNVTKTKIKNINPKFKEGNIFKLKLEKTYDNIFLSNICTYYPMEDNKKLIDKLNNNLNIDGKMLLCYLYQTKKDTKYREEWAPIYNLEKTFEILNDYITVFESLAGVQGLKFEDENIKDSVIIYQKRK